MAAQAPDCKSSRRYHVHIESKPGLLTCIQATDNRDKAVDVCNFWDERASSYLIDLVQEEARMTPLDKALRAADELLDRTNRAIDRTAFPDARPVLAVINAKRYDLWKSSGSGSYSALTLH